MSDTQPEKQTPDTLQAFDSEASSPMELPPPPRKPSGRAILYLFVPTFWSAFWVLAFFALTALFASFAWESASELFFHTKLLVSGAKTSGQLKKSTHREHYDTEDDTWEYKSTFWFSFRHEGKEIHVKQEVDWFVGPLKHLKPKSPIKVLYLPHDPSTAIVVGSFTWMRFAIHLLWFLLLMLMCFFLCWMVTAIILSYFGNWRLYCKGEATFAKVTNHKAHQKNQTTRLAWSFVVKGERISSDTEKAIALEHYTGSEQVIVIYDPKDPQAHILYIP